VDASNGAQHAEESDVKDSELDREGFDAEGYVRGLLGREGIAGLLGVEGGLVGGTCYFVDPLRFGYRSLFFERLWWNVD